MRRRQSSVTIIAVTVSISVRSLAWRSRSARLYHTQEVRGSIPRASTTTVDDDHHQPLAMRIWLNGRASSFQVDHAGSIPAVRSMITRNWRRVHVPLAAWEPGDPYHALRPRGRQAPTAQHISTRARGRRRSLRMWFNGRTAASQVADAGSTPAIRSHRSCSRGPVVRAPRLHRGHHGFESHREHDRSRGCGSTGRASRQQREGRGFDPPPSPPGRRPVVDRNLFDGVRPHVCAPTGITPSARPRSATEPDHMPA